jgi:hypothetical protein
VAMQSAAQLKLAMPLLLVLLVQNENKFKP